jgi:hypothetical protein
MAEYVPHFVRRQALHLAADGEGEVYVLPARASRVALSEGPVMAMVSTDRVIRPLNECHLVMQGPFVDLRGNLRQEMTQVPVRLRRVSCWITAALRQLQNQHSTAAWSRFPYAYDPEEGRIFPGITVELPIAALHDCDLEVDPAHPVTAVRMEGHFFLRCFCRAYLNGPAIHELFPVPPDALQEAVAPLAAAAPVRDVVVGLDNVPMANVAVIDPFIPPRDDDPFRNISLAQLNIAAPVIREVHVAGSRQEIRLINPQHPLYAYLAQWNWFVARDEDLIPGQAGIRPEGPMFLIRQHEEIDPMVAEVPAAPFGAEAIDHL